MIGLSWVGVGGVGCAVLCFVGCDGAGGAACRLHQMGGVLLGGNGRTLDVHTATLKMTKMRSNVPIISITKPPPGVISAASPMPDL